MKKKELHPFNVVLIPVIFDPKRRQILIGRRENDPDLPKLTWCFPGGRLSHGDDVDKRLKDVVKLKTGYEVKNLGTIFSKIYPEKKDLMAVYFLCEVFKGNEKAGDDIHELKWVAPEQLEKHFTTSFHPRLKEYIMNLK
jgi:8-oxo-dGTP pyrophosphatase MutT (NUDIX family)